MEVPQMETLKPNVPAKRFLTEWQEEYLRGRPPGDAVIYALQTLMELDGRLLDIDANEHSIIFRFAMYLQAKLQF